MNWTPSAGHVPRGFVGAFGTLDDVQVVIVTAEPGTPLLGEGHDLDGLPPEDRLRLICQFTYDQLAGTIGRAPDYHDNLCYILHLIWPDLSLDERLTRAWITESVLCSAPESEGAVALGIEEACRRDYLQHQLALLPGRLVLALGGKAQRRLGGAYFVAGYHPSACHGNTQRTRAMASWEAAATQIRSELKRRT